jgi:NADPH:quinone reductase-like Zn-dependent oxidoreductase
VTHVRAVVIDGFGDTPHLASFPLPGLAPDQVLIEVRAASVNAFDWKAADGRFKDAFDYQFPVTIGRDYAGVVAAVGSEVSRVRPGDEVFGYFTGQTLHRGSYATHLCVGEGECFEPRPPDLDAVTAACLPLAGVIALRCVDAVEPARGDRVLILGAPGGVGSLAVQLAVARGAHVIASGRPEDEAYLRDLGAADVIAPGEGLTGEVRQRYPEGIQGLVDLVDYRPAFLAHAELLVTGGRAASVHRAVDEVAFAERGLRGSNVSSFPDRALLTRLARLAASGDLRVTVTGRYPLDEAVTALADARDRHTRGKLVIEVNPGAAATA